MTLNQYAMKKYISHVFLLFMISLLSIDISNAKEYYKFRTFSPEGGFYYDGIKAIQQDSYGFLWILMDNDLYRFDGYDYKRHYSYFKEIDQTGTWVFHTIATDTQGHLYIATNIGLFEYDRMTNSFNKLFSSNISFLHVDKYDNIWISYDHELCILNREDKTISKPTYNGKPLTYINAIHSDNSNLYVGSYYGDIFEYDYFDENFRWCGRVENEQYIIDIEKSGDTLWALTGTYELYKINMQDFSQEDYFDFFYAEENYHIPVKAIHLDKKGSIWIGSQIGLFILNPETREYTLQTNRKDDPFSLPNNSVWTIQEDNQENIWIGTFSGGLAYFNQNEQLRFTTYTPQNSKLNYNLISSFAKDEENLWIATEGGGLNCMHLPTKEFSYYKYHYRGSGLSYNNVKSLAIDSEHNLWIATYRGGLDKLNPKTGKFTNYKHNSNNENSLIVDNLRKIVAESDSGLWIAYQLDEPVISFYSFKDEEFRHYHLDEKGYYSYIFDIHRGKNDNLWVVTHEKLYTICVKELTINEVPIPDSSFLKGQTLCMDEDDIIWIGTIGNGLVRYNSETNEFKAYEEILEFNVSSIFSICTDSYNNIWMGTDNGLFLYNKEENFFRNFEKNDGTQGQVYYPLACIESPSGELYFGGTNGFTIVNPLELSVNTFKPHVVISDFLIDNESTLPVIRNNKNMLIPEIVLDYKQVNFGFKFSSDNYLLPEKNFFKYRLVGYDNDWITTDASNRTAFYSKVPPGDYTFEIMACNNDNVWNDKPLRIQIKRLPAPWATWQAYTLYMICIALLIYTLLRYYYKQKRLRLELYLENLAKNKQREIYQIQQNFFTNISHDFRTPLFLIIATLDKLKEEGIKEYYFNILKNNSKRLLNLVNELMDFRRVESGKMELKVESLNLKEFLQKIVEDFKIYASQHNILLQFKYDNDLPEIQYFDRSIFEKIIMNLMNNSFKYTEDGGSIEIEIYKQEQQYIPRYKNSYTIHPTTALADNYFTIAIRDNGIGIDKNLLENIFERFYKVPNAKFNAQIGTGIGLSFVKTLVLFHKGSITVYSEPEKGTDILIRLPDTKQAYNEDELMNEEKSNDAFYISDLTFPSLYNETEENAIEEKQYFHNKKKILFAEDNEELRKLISEFLSPYFEIIEAPNGKIASSILEDMDIDLIISDIMMPEKDGITFCKETKNNINTSHIPFILLTAKGGIDSKVEGMDAGADLYFEKPVNLNLLMVSIKSLFERQKKLREYYSNNFQIDSTELSTNEKDNEFLKKLIEIIDNHLEETEMDVNLLATELSMSRSKLYNKVKSMTGKSIVEFILSYKLRKAAQMLVEENKTIRQAMDHIGIESQSYFSRSFKKEFGETPRNFLSKHKKNT